LGVLSASMESRTYEPAGNKFIREISLRLDVILAGFRMMV